MSISFLAPKHVEHEVNGEIVKFWPISVMQAAKLKEVLDLGPGDPRLALESGMEVRVEDGCATDVRRCRKVGLWWEEAEEERVEGTCSDVAVTDTTVTL